MAFYGAVGLGRFSGTVHSVTRTPHDLQADGQDAYCLMINGGTAWSEAGMSGASWRWRRARPR